MCEKEETGCGWSGGRREIASETQCKEMTLLDGANISQVNLTQLNARSVVFFSSLAVCDDSSIDMFQ